MKFPDVLIILAGVFLGLAFSAAGVRVIQPAHRFVPLGSDTVYALDTETGRACYPFPDDDSNGVPKCEDVLHGK
jgi:hypothetical protein